FWCRDGTRRSSDPPAKHRAFHGGVRRWLDARTVELFQYVFPDSIRRDLAGSRAEYLAPALFFEAVQVGILHSALLRLSSAKPCTPGGRNRRDVASRHERRKRNSGGRFSRAEGALSTYLADCRRSDESPHLRCAARSRCDIAGRSVVA